MPKKSEKNHHKKIKTIFTAVAVLIGLFILFDLTPFGGTMRYYGAWINCGQKPVVVVGSGFFNAGAPHYYAPPDINIFPAKSTYFCTAFDAEKHGYSANSKFYDFPVLRENNALCKKTTDPESETAAAFSPCEKS